MRNLCLIGLIVFCLSACSMQRFEINQQVPEYARPSYTGTSHFIFWGLDQSQVLNPGKACGSAGV